MAAVKHRNSRHHQSDYDLYGDLERIKDALYDTGADVKGKAGEFITSSVDDIKEKTIYARDNVANYTAERPFKSLGIALLAGVALGWLLRK